MSLLRRLRLHFNFACPLLFRSALLSFSLFFIPVFPILTCESAAIALSGWTSRYCKIYWPLQRQRLLQLLLPPLRQWRRLVVQVPLLPLKIWPKIRAITCLWKRRNDVQLFSKPLLSPFVFRTLRSIHATPLQRPACGSKYLWELHFSPKRSRYN